MTEITDEARQMAADLANAEEAFLGFKANWTPDNFEQSGMRKAFARLCTRFIAMQKDMAEIDRLTTPNAAYYRAGEQVHTIAAKYRVETDPLADAFNAAALAAGNDGSLVRRLREELAKRGVTI